MRYINILSKKRWLVFKLLKLLFKKVVDGIGFVIDLDDNDRLKFVKRYLDEVLSDP